MKKLFVFSDIEAGEDLQSVEAETLAEAEKATGLKVSDKIAYREEEILKKSKPRADKGQPRVTKTSTNVTKKDTRKRPEYFIFDGKSLTYALTHDKALKGIEDNKEPELRVIMGHEVRFSRSVKFHF